MSQPGGLKLHPGGGCHRWRVTVLPNTASSRFAPPHARSKRLTLAVMRRVATNRTRCVVRVSRVVLRGKRVVVSCARTVARLRAWRVGIARCAVWGRSAGCGGFAHSRGPHNMRFQRAALRNAAELAAVMRLYATFDTSRETGDSTYECQGNRNCHH